MRSAFAVLFWLLTIWSCLHDVNGQTIPAHNFFVTPVSGAGNTGQVRFFELSANGETYVGLKAPDLIASSTTYTFPSAYPAGNSYALVSSTAGVLSWASGGGIAGLNCGGTANAICFYDGANITGDAGFLSWDDTAKLGTIRADATGVSFPFESHNEDKTTGQHFQGVGMRFKIKNSAGTLYSAATWQTQWVNDTAGSETSIFSLISSKAGAFATGFQISGYDAFIPFGGLVLGGGASPVTGGPNTLKFYGTTSGAVIMQTAAAAGTWTMTLPTTAGTNGNFLQTDGTGITSWVAPAVATDNCSTSGAICFSGGPAVLSQDATRLFWDNTNKRLGVGTNAPLDALTVSDAISDGAISTQRAVSTSANNGFLLRTSSTIDWELYEAANTSDFRIAGASDYFTILRTNGFVGIGNTSPGALLEVEAPNVTDGSKRGDVWFHTAAANGTLNYNLRIGQRTGAVTDELFSIGSASSGPYDATTSGVNNGLYGFGLQPTFRSIGNALANVGEYVFVTSVADGVARTITNQVGAMITPGGKDANTTITNAVGLYVVQPSIGSTSNMGIGMPSGTSLAWDDGTGTTNFTSGNWDVVLGRSGANTLSLSPASGNNVNFKLATNAGAQGLFMSKLLSGAGQIYTDSPVALQFGTNAAINMTILSGGNVGIGTTGPNALLVVNGTAEVNTTATPGTNIKFLVNGHVAFAGSSPTLSFCGTAPGLSGNDTSGVITAGTGTVTSCTLTFASAFNTAPACVLSSNSTTIAVDLASTSTTSFVVGFSASFPGGNIYYFCPDRQ